MDVEESEVAVAYDVRVDKDVCMSSGRCVEEAPAAFRFDADELAEVTDDARELPAERLLDIARNCPSGAVQLFVDGDPVALY